MKLKEYLENISKKNEKKLLGELEISRSYLWQIANGQRVPSLCTKKGRILINKILIATNGKVRLKDLKPDEYDFLINEAKRLREGKK